MFGIFNGDSRIGRAVTLLADMMILSVLWLVCSLPIITAGAATTALYYASMRSVRMEGTVFKDFFRAFGQNFRQSLGLSLLVLAAGAMVAADFWILSQVQLPGEDILRIVLYIAVFLAVMVLGYAFALMARFEGTVKGHLKNALLLSLGSPLTTVVITALNAAPVLLFLLQPQWFWRAVPFIALLWTGLAAHMNSRLLLKVFQRIQPPEAAEEPEA